MTESRIAVVHDWLDTWRGGENVLAEILRVYPEADLYSLVDFLPDEYRARLNGRRARTSHRWLRQIPHVDGSFKKLRTYVNSQFHSTIHHTTTNTVVGMYK